MTDIAVSNFQKKVPVRISVVSANVHKAVKALKFAPPFLSVAFVGEQRMRRLNRAYLGHDYVTDVLTFGKRQGDGLRRPPDTSPFCEIVVCPAAAKRNAKQYGNSVEREMMLYVVHGILHLCGYDDHSSADIKRMRQKEQQIMDLP